MGYSITSAYSISPDDKHSYFIFYWGDYFVDETAKWIDNNFVNIAKALGPRGVIVRGLCKDFGNELMEIYQKDIQTMFIERRFMDMSWLMHRFFDTFEDKYNISREYQKFLLITDKNPHKIEENKDTIFYIIPLNSIENSSEIEELITDITACVKANDFSSIDNFLKRKFGKKPTNLSQVVNEAVELKPNIAGIGINLNYIVDRFLAHIGRITKS